MEQTIQQRIYPTADRVDSLEASGMNVRSASNLTARTHASAVSLDNDNEDGGIESVPVAMRNDQHQFAHAATMVSSAIGFLTTQQVTSSSKFSGAASKKDLQAMVSDIPFVILFEWDNKEHKIITFL